MKICFSIAVQELLLNGHHIQHTCIIHHSQVFLKVKKEIKATFSKVNAYIFNFFRYNFVIFIIFYLFIHFFFLVIQFFNFYFKIIVLQYKNPQSVTYFFKNSKKKNKTKQDYY